MQAFFLPRRMKMSRLSRPETFRPEAEQHRQQGERTFILAAGLRNHVYEVPVDGAVAQVPVAVAHDAVDGCLLLVRRRWEGSQVALRPVFLRHDVATEIPESPVE